MSPAAFTASLAWHLTLAAVLAVAIALRLFPRQQDVQTVAGARQALLTLDSLTRRSAEALLGPPVRREPAPMGTETVSWDFPDGTLRLEYNGEKIGGIEMAGPGRGE